MAADVADRAHLWQHPPEAAATRYVHFTDTGETYRMELSNGALTHHRTARTDPAGLTITLTRPSAAGHARRGGQQRHPARR